VKDVTAAATNGSTEPTKDLVQSTSQYIGANANQKGYDTEFGNPMVCDTITHVTHLVVLLHTGSTEGNLTGTKPLLRWTTSSVQSPKWKRRKMPLSLRGGLPRLSIS
jgi:hypothetical protein